MSLAIKAEQSPSSIYERIHTRLSQCNDIREVSQIKLPSECEDVGMDELNVCASKTAAIATSGVGSCFAICSRGKSKEGIPVLGLCHTSHATPFNQTYKKLKKFMVQNECDPKTIETYVIGGMPPSSEDDYPGTVEEINDVLDVALKDPAIKGVRFNVIKSERDCPLGVSVLLTSTGLFFSKSPFGNPDVGQ